MAPFFAALSRGRGQVRPLDILAGNGDHSGAGLAILELYEQDAELARILDDRGCGLPRRYCFRPWRPYSAFALSRTLAPSTTLNIVKALT